MPVGVAKQGIPNCQVGALLSEIHKRARLAPDPGAPAGPLPDHVGTELDADQIIAGVNSRVAGRGRSLQDRRGQEARRLNAFTSLQVVFLNMILQDV